MQIQTGYRWSLGKDENEPAAVVCGQLNLEDPAEAGKRMSGLQSELLRLHGRTWQPEKKCPAYTTYFIKGVFLLGLSGAAIYGVFHTAKIAVDTKAKGYIAAAFFLAIAAVVLLASTGIYFCRTKKTRTPESFLVSAISNIDYEHQGHCVLHNH